MKAIINPFIRLVEIELGDSSVLIRFNYLDEWRRFELNGKLYDCHFDYKEELDAMSFVSVYAIDENGEPDWQWSLIDEVQIKY